MAGPCCERLNGMASRIDISPPPTNAASWAAPVSLSVRVLTNFSVPSCNSNFADRRLDVSVHLGGGLVTITSRPTSAAT